MSNWILWGDMKCEVCGFYLDANNFTGRCSRHKAKTVCDCPAGYGQNHTVHCALAREAIDGVDGQEPDGLLDYPRSALSEAIIRGIE